MPVRFTMPAEEMLVGRDVPARVGTRVVMRESMQHDKGVGTISEVTCLVDQVHLSFTSSVVLGSVSFQSVRARASSMWMYDMMLMSSDSVLVQ